jgi:DNA-directed RNA polymerase subunit RPC12/RpoP
MNRTIIGGRTPGRNDPCPCGSGLKYKHCHGDQLKKDLMLCPCGSGLKYKHCHGDLKKLQVVEKLSNALMGQLIIREKMEHGLIPFPYTCNKCGKGFIKPKEGTIVSSMLLCPYCDSTDIEKYEPAKPQAETTIIGGNS